MRKPAIAPFSTIGYRGDQEYWRDWFPADWISESFPGQFRNWFYSLLAMSATLEEQVRLAAEVGGLTAATVKPNFKALRPRFGRRMKEVAAAIAAADATAVAAQAAAGDPVRIGEFELQAEDLVVETAPREAYAIATEPGCQVGVLKELTPELRAEGVVREAVHMINNLRRESGFAIADRITLYAAAADPVQAALQAHEELLAAEVLATAVHYADPPAAAATHRATIAGFAVTFGVVRNHHSSPA